MPQVGKEKEKKEKKEKKKKRESRPAYAILARKAQIRFPIMWIKKKRGGGGGGKEDTTGVLLGWPACNDRVGLPAYFRKKKKRKEGEKTTPWSSPQPRHRRAPSALDRGKKKEGERGRKRRLQRMASRLQQYDFFVLAVF